MKSQAINAPSLPKDKQLRQTRARIIVLLMLVAGILMPAQSAAAPQKAAPVLAYYYIWFDAKSWDRAKTDYPVLGRYSSDEASIMREHIRLAKQVGIDGFIVSWKSTEKLNRRLERLINIANEEEFKLSIIYQGLDFYRKPLPISQIEADLDLFVGAYAQNPAFDMFPKPMVIWSGTWEFEASDIEKVASIYRDRVLLLGSEKNVAGYERIAEFTDGNAYYWSSVNPETYPDYQGKLDEMAAAVHSHNGVWVAPAAPGFDARLIGGTRAVERKDGATLKVQMTAARASTPDAVGLISWNEYSENSHIEPSTNYGTKYLEVLAELNGRTFRDGIAAQDDSSEMTTPNQRTYNLTPLISLSLLLAMTVTAITFTMRRAQRGTGSQNNMEEFIQNP